MVAFITPTFCLVHELAASGIAFYTCRDFWG